MFSACANTDRFMAQCPIWVAKNQEVGQYEPGAQKDRWGQKRNKGRIGEMEKGSSSFSVVETNGNDRECEEMSEAHVNVGTRQVNLSHITGGHSWAWQ